MQNIQVKAVCKIEVLLSTVTDNKKEIILPNLIFILDLRFSDIGFLMIESLRL